MDFSTSTTQSQLREAVRAFAATHILPYRMAWDEQEALPPHLIEKLGQQGWLGSIFPRHLGGAGLGYAEYVTVVEELSRVDPSVGLFVASHTSLCCNHIYKAGNDEQRRRYLPELASGRMVGCWAFTEPGAGSDAAGMTTTARLDGNEWVITGQKKFTTNALTAGVAVVMAATDPGRPQHSISAFLVDRDTPGYVVTERVPTLGLRACATSGLLLQDVRVPAGNLIGTRGRGFVDCLRILDGGRISIAALALGIAQGAYEAALAYAKTRQQFGQAIADFQVIQHKLVDMALAIESGRLLTLKAAWKADHGERHSVESAMAKLAAGDMAVRVTDEALQIHGGSGLVRGSVPEKFYRDAKLCTIGEGTSEIQKLVIARHILKEEVPVVVAAQQPAGEVMVG